MATTYYIGEFELTTSNDKGLTIERYGDYWKARMYCADSFSVDIQTYLIPNTIIAMSVITDDDTISISGNVTHWASATDYSYVDVLDAVISSTYIPSGGGGEGGVSDHGALTGLTDDDHAQYLNITRGDSRYIKIGEEGDITSHSNLTGLGNDDHTQYYDETRGDARYLKIIDDITDHGDLTGLADDDHTQYFNETRGDARYIKIGDITGGWYDI